MPVAFDPGEMTSGAPPSRFDPLTEAFAGSRGRKPMDPRSVPVVTMQSQLPAPAGVGRDVLPPHVVEALASVSRFHSPSKVVSGWQGQEGKAPVPASVTEGPADSKEFQNNDHDRLRSDPFRKSHAWSDRCGFPFPVVGQTVNRIPCARETGGSPGTSHSNGSRWSTLGTVESAGQIPVDLAPG